MEALPMSRKPHAALRGRMTERDVTGKYLARLWLVTEQCISSRMTGRTPWTIHEVYDLMELLNIEPERMAEFFPDYRNRKPVKKSREARR